MAMKANGSAKANRNPHVAKTVLKSSKTAIALALTVPWNSNALVGAKPKIVVPQTPVISAEVIRIEEAPRASIAVETTADGHVGLDESIAYESWLEAYSLYQLSAVEIPLDIGEFNTVRSINGKMKTTEVTKVMACWLLPGDSWGKGSSPDPEYPTRTKYRKVNGLSHYHRKKVHLVVDNGALYKGPSWSSEFSTQKPIKGFESWGRPPTSADVLAEHWNNLARRSDYEYEEVFIQTRKKPKQWIPNSKGEQYKSLPISDCTVINWKVRDASLWGPTLLESTFGDLKSKKQVQQPRPLEVEQVIEQQATFESTNVVDVNEYGPATNDTSLDDLSNYGSPMETDEQLLYEEQKAISQLKNRWRAKYALRYLNVKITALGWDLHAEAMRYATWLRTRMVHNARLIPREIVEYRLNKQFYPWLQGNRHTQVLTQFDVTIKTKYVKGVKQEYRTYEKVGTFIGVKAYSASPPVLRQSPAPSQKLADDSRYNLWLMVFANPKRTSVPPVDPSASDPDLTVSIHISQANWKYLVACNRVSPEVLDRVSDEQVYLLPKPEKREPVTFAQEVLLGEIKLRNERRLERDFEFLEPVNTRKEPAIGDELVGPFKPQPLILLPDFDTIESVTSQELVIDPTWTPKVLEQMKGPLVFPAKVAKQDEPPNGDLSKFGTRFTTNGSQSLLLPLSPTSARPRSQEQPEQVKLEVAISPQEFRCLLPDKQFGRKRGTLLQKAKRFIAG